MTQINWPSLPEANEAQKAAADLLIRLEDGRECRTGYDGGWLYFADATHTAESKQAVASGAQAHYTVDGLGANTIAEYRRGIPLDIWSNSTIQPQAAGEVYQIALQFRLSKSTSTATYLRIEVGIGADYSTIIAEDRRPLVKGSGVDDFLFFSGPLFVTPAFGRYGARFILAPSEDIEVWDKTIFLQRTHSP